MKIAHEGIDDGLRRHRRGAVTRKHGSAERSGVLSDGLLNQSHLSSTTRNSINNAFSPQGATICEVLADKKKYLTINLGT